VILKLIEGSDNAVLRRRSEEVGDVADEELQVFVRDMRETLASIENGIGLAAPQVGKNIRLFVIAEEFAESTGGVTAFVNPELLRASFKKTKEDEGCLSLPDVWHTVARSERVTLCAIDEYGKTVKIRARGLLARLFQHEVDHLQGKLFIDRVRR
jgi:peptide deformylase